MGDFNGKIGKKESNYETSIGKYGLGSRNSRGQKLLNFLHQKNLFAMNTFFYKKPQHEWTWKHPNGVNKNEYDYIITDRKGTIQNVSVLNRFCTGSDHRLVRATCSFNLRKERRKLITKNSTPRDFQIKIIKYNGDQYREIIQSGLNMDDIEQMPIENINKHIIECMKSALEIITPKVPTPRPQKLSKETIYQMEQRRQMRETSNIDKPEYSKLEKEIRKNIRKDIKKYEENLIENTIERNSSRKTMKFQLSTGRKQIYKIYNERNEVVTNRTELLDTVRRYYQNLYQSKISKSISDMSGYSTRQPIRNTGSEEMLDVTVGEIGLALRHLKNLRAPGEDGIIPEMIKAGPQDLHLALATLYSKCLVESTVPVSWNNAVITLLHKKGDIKKLENYRPISLLSHIYKLFSRIIVNRLQKKLDFYQPCEQAGFRSGYSTCDHLQTIKTIIEKCHEYKKMIIIAFIDYEKAFDTVEAWAVEEALADCRIDERYITVLKHLQDHATACISLHEKTDKFKLARGVRQGDTISPKLFTAVLENIFKRLDWEEKGLRIDGEHLSNLRFADDLVLFSDNIEDMLVMLDDLKSVSGKVGLKMNLNKTKIMTNIPEAQDYQLPVKMVNSYIYLGHKIALGSENQTVEVDRRISQAWAAFGANKHTLCGNLPIRLKTKVYDQCVMPVLTYGTETMSLTKKSAEKFRVAQRAMERAMLGITLLERKPNEWIRRRTCIKDVITRIAEQKWKWAGHIARMENSRWTKRTLEWRPRENTRPRGRPPTRWVDDIRRHGGRNWMERAQDRQMWIEMGEAYVQQWTL